MANINLELPISWQAMGTLAILKAFIGDPRNGGGIYPATLPGSDRTLAELPDLNVNLYPYLEGRERGYVLVVSRGKLPSKVLFIAFAENRSSDEIFVMHQEVSNPSYTHYWSDCVATGDNFKDAAFKNRLYFPEGSFTAAAEAIVDQIAEFWDGSNEKENAA
jgi:hypothetical protein